MNLLPYAIVWAVLAVIVIGLAIFRSMVAGHEDEALHVADNNTAAISEQRAVANKLTAIEKWGKSLTVVVAVSGLVLLGVFIYDLWMQGSGYVPQ
jgi:hypothetical protein